MRKLILYLFLASCLLAGVALSAREVLADPSPVKPYPFYIYFPLVKQTEPPTWIGPDGGFIVSLVVDPKNSQVVYAGSWGAGVFKSSDGGTTWTAANAGLGNLFINSLAIDPQNPQVLYAGTYKDRLYKSEDGGASWFKASTGIQEQAIVYSIAINPQNTNQIYISTRGISNNGSQPWNGVVYVSYNGGASWQVSLENISGPTYQDWVYSLAIDPQSPWNIYAAVHEHYFMRSFVAGVYWEQVGEGLVDYSGRAVAVDPQNPKTLYYGSWHGGGVFRSDDRGDTWEQKSPSGILPKIYALVIDPQQPMTVYMVSFFTGVYKTQDKGENWNYSGMSQDRLYSMAVDPNNSSALYVGTAGNGLYKSSNGGISWSHNQAGLQNSWSSGLIVSPSNPNELVTSSLGGGILRSVDRGVSWQDFSEGLPDKIIHSLVFRPDQPSVLFALTDGAGLYTRDLSGGAAWSAVNSGLPAAPARTASDVKPAHEPTLWDALENPFSPLFTAPDALAPLLSLAFAPSNPKIAYLGTDGAGLYRSIDAGVSWYPVGLENQSVRSIAVDPLNADRFYAATDRIGGIYFSPNGGNSWQFIDLPYLTVSALFISPAQPGVLYAGTNDGLYRLENDVWSFAGLTWQKILTVVANPARPDELQVGSAIGAYFSSDAGMTWTSAPAQLTNLAVQSISFDPANAGVVYYSTQTHGVLRVDYGP